MDISALFRVRKKNLEEDTKLKLSRTVEILVGRKW